MDAAGANAYIVAAKREAMYRAIDNLNYVHEQVGAATYPVLATAMFVRQSNLNAATFTTNYDSIAAIIMSATPEIKSVISNIAVRCCHCI